MMSLEEITKFEQLQSSFFTTSTVIFSRLKKTTGTVAGRHY
jgi:hypothetical protein